jgi:CheY-like chemotaxis protein
VRFFGGRAWLSGHSSIGDLTSAFEATLFDIVFKGSDPTPSVLQTIAQAVDCLGRILIPGNPNFAPRNRRSKVLVVDDDAVFNYTTTVALNRANLDVVCVQDPTASLQTMQTDRFDIVLLDINMPGMDGFAVCKALRQIPAYKSIPVIFVTKLSEFQNRARSIIAGGTDLFVKPIAPLELGLKVTMRLLDPGVQPQKSDTAQRVLQRRQHPNRALISEANHREPSKFQRRTEGETETLRSPRMHHRWKTSDCG